MKEKMVTVRQAAKLMKVSEWVIRHWIHEGYLRDVKRFPPNKRGKFYIPETELPSFLRGK